MSASWETWTSPLYINSSRAAMLSGVVASSMMTHWPFVGVFSNRSANFFEQAANISLWALNTAPGIREEIVGKCEDFSFIT